MNYTKFDWYKKYPKKEERTSITAVTHNLGNFQTIIKLKSHITGNKTNYVKKCKICIRADEVRPIHHAALALDVTGLFERVCIDLSFGYPTPVDGFKGMLVMIEYLSGYVIYKYKTNHGS